MTSSSKPNHFGMLENLLGAGFMTFILTVLYVALSIFCNFCNSYLRACTARGAVSAPLAVLLMLTAVSCTVPVRPQAAQPQCDIATDVTASVGTQQAELECQLINAIVEDALSPQTRLSICTFGDHKDPTPVFSGVAYDAEDLALVEKAILNHHTESQGTYVVPVLRRWLQLAKKVGAGRKWAFVLITDGGFDDMAAAVPLADALASCPNVTTVAILGISQTAQHQINARFQIEKTFAAFGNRLVIGGEGDIEQAINDMRDHIQREESKTQ